MVTPVPQMKHDTTLPANIVSSERQYCITALLKVPVIQNSAIQELETLIRKTALKSCLIK
jgi:hypothetical protein